MSSIRCKKEKFNVVKIVFLQIENQVYKILFYFIYTKSINLKNNIAIVQSLTMELNSMLTPATIKELKKNYLHNNAFI